MAFIFFTTKEKFFSGRCVSMERHVKTALSFYRLSDRGSEQRQDPTLVPQQPNSRRRTRTHISWLLAQRCHQDSAYDPATWLHVPRIELWSSSNFRSDLGINYLHKSPRPVSHTSGSRKLTICSSSPFYCGNGSIVLAAVPALPPSWNLSVCGCTQQSWICSPICTRPAGFGICGIQESYPRVGGHWKTTSLIPPSPPCPPFLSLMDKKKRTTLGTYFSIWMITESNFANQI